MAKNVIIHGVEYHDLPAITAPLIDGSGDAKFVDTDSGDATAADIRNGKKAWAGGVEITGNKPEKAAGDVTVSGKTVSIPAGIYDNPVSKSIADGSVTPGATVAGDEIGDAASDYEVSVNPSATVGAGYVSGNKTGTQIKKYIQVEEKEATPAMTEQNITPSSGKLLKSVKVKAVSLSGNAQPSNVDAGVIFFSNSLTPQTGTGTHPTLVQDPVTKILRIS